METENVNKILVNKSKNLTYDELITFSQEELANKILQLQANNLQLRNIIAKMNGDKKSAPSKKERRKFNFENHRKQHIFLKLLYLGWDYQGYACQEDSSETIEHYLINALLTCRLIESRDTSNYNRCGRTDKGVSSFDQVVSLTVRASEEGKLPLEYCKMLNRLLPENIRVTAWCPVPDDFSARFNCTKRTYHYFFPKSNLDLEKMNEAAQYLVGVHDFRNLCKMDVGNGVTNFVRSIDSTCITQLENSTNNGFQMCQLELVGKAFLWHQVRAIMAVLLLVGKNLEKPSIILELLDVETNARKPQYNLASPLGLNLYKCLFEDVLWNFDSSELTNVVGTLQRLWTEQKIKATQIESMIFSLEKQLPEPVYQQTLALMKIESKQYKPLLSRSKCNSLEDRIQQLVKKRKLEIKDDIE